MLFTFLKRLKNYILKKRVYFVIKFYNEEEKLTGQIIVKNAFDADVKKIEKKALEKIAKYPDYHFFKIEKILI